MSTISEWRAFMGITQRRAASALGMTLKAYQELERGTSFDTGKPMVPDRRTLLALDALAKGCKPWSANLTTDTHICENPDCAVVHAKQLRKCPQCGATRREARERRLAEDWKPAARQERS